MASNRHPTGSHRLPVVGSLLLAAFLTGCATGRDVMDVRVGGMPDNPATGKAITFSKVRDARIFEAYPRQNPNPSLKNKKEVTDRSVTVRAIARKSGSFGNTMGDIVLPEGRTVEQLVEEALTKGFRESGLRVVANKAADAQAIPIVVEIDQFWTWFEPGFWTIQLKFEARLKLTGALPPFEQGDYVFAEASHSTGAATGGAWRETFQQGLNAIVVAVSKQLKATK